MQNLQTGPIVEFLLLLKLLQKEESSFTSLCVPEPVLLVLQADLVKESLGGSLVGLGSGHDLGRQDVVSGVAAAPRMNFYKEN